MTSLHDRLVRRFGDDIVGWVRSAPGEAERLAAEWDLTLAEPFPHGSTSLTMACTTADGRAAVLKLSPQTDVLAEQDVVLRAWAPGGHVPEVFRAAPGALLLERVRPGTSVTAPEPLALARLLDGLHRVPVPDGLVIPELGHGTEQFLSRVEGQLARFGPADVALPSDFARARAERDRLVATSRPPVLLHGDLHYDNMLDGGSRGLIAIDPKATSGEREFDAVDFVLDGSEAPERRIERLVAVTELDPARLAGWSRVAAPVVAVGLHRKGADPAEILRFARS